VRSGRERRETIDPCVIWSCSQPIVTLEAEVPMYRFSICTLMVFVLVSAIGLAALRNANELWAGTMPLVALAATGTAVLGAVILRGRERFWWLGFALFSGGYLTLALGPWQSDTFQPQLGTTQLLNFVQAKLGGVQLDTNVAPAPFQGFVLKRSAGPPTVLVVTITPFQRVGHSLFAMVAGVGGGMIAVWFHARRRLNDVGGSK
jgi:hypothetical protein